MEGKYFLKSFVRRGVGTFLIEGVEIPSPKKVKNLPWIYKKLHCNGEPYRFINGRYLCLQTDKKISTFNVKGLRIKIPLPASNVNFSHASLCIWSSCSWYTCGIWWLALWQTFMWTFLRMFAILMLHNPQTCCWSKIIQIFKDSLKKGRVMDYFSCMLTFLLEKINVRFGINIIRAERPIYWMRLNTSWVSTRIFRYYWSHFWIFNYHWKNLWILNTIREYLSTIEPHIQITVWKIQ